MKTVFLTGYKGFVGSNLLKALNSKKYRVIKWEKEDYKEKWESKLFELFETKPIDTVWHVGADANTLNHNVNDVMFLNCKTTKFLSDLCKYKNIKFIYSSSAANYGLDGNLPINLYGWSKKIGEDYTLYNNQIALRYFNIIGETDNRKGKMSSVGWQSLEKYKREEPVLLYPGKPTRDFVYIKDIILANLYAEKFYDKFCGKYYDVGSGESRLFEDVLRLLRIPFKYEKDNPLLNNGYQNFTLADTDKFMYNWTPKFKLEDAIIDWQRELNISN